MLGMNQIKKKMLIGFAIGLLIGIVIAGISIAISVVTVKGYQEGTSKEFIEKYQRTVACFTKDVRQGEKITQDMVNDVYVHINNVPENAVGSSGELVGQVAKYNIPKNIPLVYNMVTTQLVKKDERIVETNYVLLPSDLVEGDVVDIRLMYPTAEDYVVIPQVRVDKIYGTTMYFKITEEEMLLLDSAMVDSFLYDGSKLYAVKYADIDAQVVYGEDDAEKEMRLKIYEEIDKVKGEDIEEGITTILDFAKDWNQLITAKGGIEQNYQPNTYVQELMKTRPNIVEEAKAKLSEENRALVEARLVGYAALNEDIYGTLTAAIKSSFDAQKQLRETMATDAANAQAAAAATDGTATNGTAAQ